VTATIQLTVNGDPVRLEVVGSENLLRVLREQLGLPGSKSACEQGECGACSVVMDGLVVCACLVLAVDAQGATIVTVEGIAYGDELHPVQEAMLAAGAVQCGFCTPGFVVAIAKLLEGGAWLSEGDIREGLAGNLCRCTGYGAILRAVRAAGPRA